MSRFKSLSDRMKAYEAVFSNNLMPRTPTIVRLDGRSFSKYTKSLKRPFTKSLFENMELTTEYLVKNIQGCKLGYYQSDEITLILTDWDDLDTQSFFDGGVQKVVSIIASMATSMMTLYENIDLVQITKQPQFDCRVFQVPTVTEIVNCLVWRQQDAVRNSIQACARSVISHSDSYKKNREDLQELIFQNSAKFKQNIIECGWGDDIPLGKDNFNWNDLPDKTKRGVFVYKSLEDSEDGVRGKKRYEHEALDLTTDEAKCFIVEDIIPVLDDYWIQ